MPDAPASPAAAHGDNKNATRSLWLGLASLLCCAFTGLPAVVLGVVALRSGNPRGRAEAWVGIIAGAFFTIAWTATWAIGQAATAADREQQRVAAEKRHEEEVAARKKAVAEAPARIEEARSAASAGNTDAAVKTVDSLRTLGVEVPNDLAAVWAKDRLTRAKSAAAEKRWDEARRLAIDAKGSDAALSGEADPLISKATSALEKAAAVEKAAAAKAAAAAEKAAAQREAAELDAKSVKESCAQVSRKFGPESSLSELQKEEAWKGYEGKLFAWELEMVEADSSFGKFVVSWKCQNSPSLMWDVHMTYPKRDREYVLGLKKGYLYKVKGKFTRAGSLLGISADPAD